jgi:gluconolactonase
MSVQIRDPRFGDVVGEDAEIEQIATGFGFTEGPIWHPEQHFLIFSDMRHDHQRRWSAADGVSTYRHPSNKANGSAFDRQGRVVSCEHQTSRVVRIEGDGIETVLASHFDGRELNSPNDIVVRSDGAIYFTDPTYGRAREDIGLLRAIEQPHQGLYRIDPDSGAVGLLVDDFWQPNGLCFSVDERKLFVNDTPRFHVRAFDVAADGDVSGGDVWAETLDSNGEKPDGRHPDTPPGMKPDGMKVDREDNLYVVGPGGVHVFAPNATCLGVILVPEHTTNFAFGDADFRSLYITASASVYRVRVKAPGFAAF